MKIIVVLVILAVAVASALRGPLIRITPFFVAGCLLSIVTLLVGFTPITFSNPPSLDWQWSQYFGANFNFRLDGLSLVMAVLICFIGAGVFLYSAAYMKTAPHLNRFYTTLTLFTAAMLGIVLADNMIAFFLFWEMTSVCSFLLVGTKFKSEDAKQSARKALFITVGGGLALLVGLLLLSVYGLSTGLSLSDSLRFSQIDPAIVHTAYYPTIVACIALAVATKSAQVPCHIWLPAAMAGPTPVSSFLHSATMVKAGVFLLARLTPTLGDTELWQITFTVMGALTMLTGAILSACQRDIKKILAFSTIAVLGILVMLLGIGTDKSIKAAVVFLVAHAFYKAALFQVIGNIDHATGSRDIKTLGSLGAFMPLTAIAACLSVLSMAGAPPLVGFFGKEIAYLSKLQLDTIGWPLMVVAVLANILLVGLAISVFYRPFVSKRRKPDTIQKVPFLMSLSPFTFSLCGLLIGIFPAVFDQNFGSPMVSTIAGEPLVLKLKLWHGVNIESLTVLGLSALTLGAGLLVAVRIKHVIFHFSQVLKVLEPYGPNRLYDRTIANIPVAAGHLMSRIQNGDLSSYVRRTLVGALLIIAIPALPMLANDMKVLEVSWFELFMTAIIAAPAALLLPIENQLTRVLLLGAVGFGLVMVFMVWAAPDLALTQLLVEGLVLIFLITLLQSFKGQQSNSVVKCPISYAIAFGLSLCCTLLLFADVSQLPNELKSFFLENALPEAYGKNVVNVILVDFRALDTFGEVVVVAIAALGCAALLLPKLRRKQHG